ncbi:MAG: pitrilysin family protein [Paludibacteraceae bacterium]
MDIYKIHTLSNGLRLVHLPVNTAVAYCGVIVNVGSRDENEREYGISHLIEHMLFKGTEKRKSGQIIERLENVGGEINAYTTKEETVFYATFMKKYTKRAIELLSDVVLHSTFPQQELDKEIIVVQDEIQSYNDSPSELIFDDFEELIFHSNPMEHNILGTRKHLKSFSSGKLNTYFKTHYRPDEMVFFSVGGVSFDKIINWCESYFISSSNQADTAGRITPIVQPWSNKVIKRKTNQVHCLMGGEAYSFHHPDRLSLYLLNNILGGPGMSSLLNLSLREKHGLVYTVESNYQPFTDCGWWAVYFGTDADNAEKCEQLVKTELKKLCDDKLSPNKLKQYQLQLMGQMAIASENKENMALSLGKSILRYGKFDSLDKINENIRSLTAEQLQRVANEVFNIEKINILKYV